MKDDSICNKCIEVCKATHPRKECSLLKDKNESQEEFDDNERERMFCVELMANAMYERIHSSTACVDMDNEAYTAMLPRIKSRDDELKRILHRLHRLKGIWNVTKYRFIRAKDEINELRKKIERLENRKKLYKNAWINKKAQVHWMCMDIERLEKENEELKERNGNK